MSFGELLRVAGSGVPGLDAAFTVVQATYTSIEDVKICRQQCRDLNRRCEDLISSLNDSSVGLEGQRALVLVDEVTFAVERMNRKVAEWAALNRIRSFLQQRDIKEGIDKCHRDLDAVFMKVSLQMNMELSRGQLETRQHQERDKAELRDLLENIIRSNDDMKTLLNMQSSPESPQPVVQVMESLQTELQHPDLEPDQMESFKRGLWVLHENTQELPPLENLTGQVTMISEWPVAKGTFNDVYQGKWLDREDVALRLPRVLENTPIVQKRFEREVGIWRGLSHPNIVPLYGMVYLRELMYSVSLWMDNGTAIAYVNKTPNVDRVHLLSQVAEGLEYLHENGIVHGDLRGANVLIDGHGIARLSDFGLSKFLEDCGNGMTSSNANPRWTAPELAHENGQLSPSSDIWSFGMTALEILTGEQPFKEIPRDVTVVLEVYKGSIPKRPHGNTPHLTDALWTLMNDCWHKRPEKRPSAKVVRQRLEVMRQGRALTGSVSSPEHKRRSSLFSLKRPSTTDSASSGKSHHSSAFLRLFPTTPKKMIEEEKDDSLLSPVSITISSESSLPSPRSANSLITFPPLSASPESLGNMELPQLDVLSHSGSFTKSPSLSESFRTSNSPDLSFPSPPSSISSNSLPPSLRPPDPRIVLNTSASGYVLSGTVEGLVDRLIKSTASVADSEFREIFLNTYLAFSTSEDVFNFIDSRFESAYEESSVELRIQVHSNILTVIKHWLSNSHIRVEPALLSLMKEFCLSALPRMGSLLMIEKLKEILRAIDSHQQGNNLSSVPSSPNQKILKTPDITPRDLAIGLGLLEGDSYKSILPSDYLAHLSDHPSRIKDAWDLNNRIVTWVKKSILHYSEVERRVQVLKFFANAADECRKMYNFSSLSAIATALQSTPIDRLHRTRESLPPHTQSIIAEVRDILDPKSNHAAYRNAMMKVSRDPPYQDRCIPWIAVHLRDLKTVLETHPAVITDNGRALINFERYAHFMDRVKEVLYFLPPDLERYRADGQAAYLDGQIRSIRLDSQTDDGLLQKSRDLEAEENRDYRRRTSELKSLGFKTK